MNANMFCHRKTVPLYAEGIHNFATSTVWIPSKHHFHAGWWTSAHWLSCKAIIKAAFHRCMGDQPSSFNSMVFSFTDIAPCDFWFSSFLKDNIYRKKLWLCQIWRITFGPVFLVFRKFTTFKLWKTVVLQVLHSFVEHWYDHDRRQLEKFLCYFII